GPALGFHLHAPLSREQSGGWLRCDSGSVRIARNPRKGSRLMGRWLIPLLLAMACANYVHAGLYESGQPYEFMPRDGKVMSHSFDNFRIRLSDLRGIAVNLPQPSSLRQKYLARRDELNSARRRLSAPELDVLGACNYRLYDLEAAISAWLEASRKD